MKRHIYADAMTRALIIFLLSLLIGGTITALCGCTRKIYVPVERAITRTDTSYNTQIRVDTILQHDSVTVQQTGDTIRVTRWRDRYRVRQRTDTIYRTKTDTIRIQTPVPVSGSGLSGAAAPSASGPRYILPLIMIAILIAAVLARIYLDRRKKP